MVIPQSSAFRVRNQRDEGRRPLLRRPLSNRNETNLTRSPFNISTGEIPAMYRGLFFNPHQIREKLMYQRTSKQYYRLTGSSHDESLIVMNKETGTTLNLDHSFYDTDRLHGRQEEEVLPSLPGDGGLCCATEIQLHPLTYLENEFGRRYIVSLDDSYNYQYIPIGTCVRNYGICHGQVGRCTVETVARTVLVWTDPELSPPFAFEWFDIPNHCTCRNVH